jgi:hypothetical protein
MFLINLCIEIVIIPDSVMASTLLPTQRPIVCTNSDAGLGFLGLVIEKALAASIFEDRSVSFGNEFLQIARLRQIVASRNLDWEKSRSVH